MKWFILSQSVLNGFTRLYIVFDCSNQKPVPECVASVYVFLLDRALENNEKRDRGKKRRNRQWISTIETVDSLCNWDRWPFDLHLVINGTVKRLKRCDWAWPKALNLIEHTEHEQLNYVSINWIKSINRFLLFPLFSVSSLPAIVVFFPILFARQKAIGNGKQKCSSALARALYLLACCSRP